MAKAASAQSGTVSQTGAGRINRIKLLLALDALLREGSVGGAAASLGMQTSAMSRLLGELRQLYNDPILMRTGQGMRPTPLAESLRMRVRAVAAETQLLLETDLTTGPTGPSLTAADGWSAPTSLPAPPLSVTPADRLEATPTPAGVARKLAAIGGNADPHRRLAKYIAITASGPGHSRPLTLEEARDALGIILRGEADPVQIGALLLTMQYRGATAAELAGFVQAVRMTSAQRIKGGPKPDLDWPVYLSPNWRSPPWFMHSARLIAMAGHRVLLHGHFGLGTDSGKLELAAQDARIPVCLSLQDASAALDIHNIAYMPLGAIAPQVQSILALYPLLEMRTPLNATVHLINPLKARATIVGAAHHSKRTLYRDMARFLDIDHMAIIGSIRDFAQMMPDRATPLFRLVDGVDIDSVVAARQSAKGEGRGSFTQREYWRAVWTGAARDDQAEACIVSTAAAALLCLARDEAATFEDALSEAEALWSNRRK